MIVAITGGTGFIGRKLVERHLTLGDGVRVLTRRSIDETVALGPVERFRGDLAVDGGIPPSFVDGAEVLYHCAGEILRPDRMANLHVEGTRRLIAAARGRIKRWVQLSSVGAYGRRSQGTVLESTSLAPQNVYEQTKLLSDELVTEASNAGAFEAVTLRPSIVFGPGMTSRSLYQWIALISRRLFFYVGPPGASANYIYVDNVIEALQQCATVGHAAGNVYNISDWRSVESFVETIAECLGTRAPRLRLPMGPVRLAARCLQRVPRMPITEARVQALCTRVRYPSERIMRELGYTHPVTMEEGVQQTVEFWREPQTYQPTFAGNGTSL